MGAHTRIAPPEPVKLPHVRTETVEYLIDRGFGTERGTLRVSAAHGRVGLFPDHAHSLSAWWLLDDEAPTLAYLLGHVDKAAAYEIGYMHVTGPTRISGILTVRSDGSLTGLKHAHNLCHTMWLEPAQALLLTGYLTAAQDTAVAQRETIKSNARATTAA